MKLDYKGAAILVILFGAAIAGSYTLGLKSDKQARTTTMSGMEGDMLPGMGGQQVPLDHPPMDGGTTPAPLLPPGGQDASLRAGNNRFTHFRVGNRNVKGLYVDDKYAWIGTSGGVIRYDMSNDQHVIFDNKVSGILSNGVFHISKLGERIVAGTYGGGLSLYDPSRDSWSNYNIPHGLADQFVYDVAQTANGDVWIATWSGANLVSKGRFDDASQWTTYNVENTGGGLPNRWVYSIEEGRDGAIWMATEEGLARFRDGKWKNWKHSDGLGAPFEQVRDAIRFTNDPGKASQHHARNKEEQGLQNVNVAYNPNYIISLAVDSDGTVWCGTWGGGLARFDGKKWRNFTTADGLPANHVFMLHIDGEGQLWAGTNQGLARLNRDGKGFTVMTTQDGLFADNVFSMTHAPDGTMWVGSFGGVARIADRM